MEQFEKVEKLREKANVSYETAKAALEESNWDLLDAVIYLEKQGKVEEPKASAYTTRSEALTGTVEDAEKAEKKGEGKFKKFTDWFVELVKKSNRNFLEIEKDGKNIVNIPVSLFVLLLLFCFWVIVPLMIVGLFFSMKYHFSGPDIHSVDVDINAAMDSVSKTAENIKSEFTSAKEEKKED